MDLDEKNRELIRECVEQAGLQLYDAGFRREDGQKVLQVIICRADYSMDIDTCEMISGKLSDLLDEETTIPGSYLLEVCSPGAERELKTEEQLRSALGQYVHIELRDPKEGIDKLEGYLRRISETELEIEYLTKNRKKTFIASRPNVRIARLAVKI